MKRPLVLLTLVAALVRVVFVGLTSSDSLRYPDAVEYLDIARHIEEGRGFVTADGKLFARGPAYPLFLSAHLVVFGDHELPIRVTQALLGALVVPLTWLLARRVASPTGAFLASLYVALDPFLIYFTGLLLVETLYVLLLGLQVLLLLRLAEGHRFRDAVALGAVAAVSALLHAGHLASLGLMAVVLPFLVTGARRWALLAVYVVSATATLFPWITRNGELSGRFIPVTAKLGRDLYESIGPGATGGPATEYVWPQGVPKMPELELDAKYRKECWRVVREEPGRVLGLVPSKFARFWNPVPNYEKFRQPLYLVAATGASLPLFALGLLGAAILIRRNLRTGIAFLFFPIAICALHLVFVGSVRYRLPLHPVLAAIAAVGVDRVSRRAPESRNRLDG
ncbi:MAG: glycosyltransferase family 39 protein [Planctomycetota bacterium]